MPLAYLFWTLMLLALVFGGFAVFKKDWPLAGGSLLTFLLFLVLGWAEFGSPIK